mgnify:CR=1 FL=1
MLEFYGVDCSRGTAVAALWPGCAPAMRCTSRRIRPAFSCCAKLPDARTLWLLSTGTGIAPFLSILRTEAPWQRFRERSAGTCGARMPENLIYRDMISRLQKQKARAALRQLRQPRGRRLARLPAASRPRSATGGSSRRRLRALRRNLAGPALRQPGHAARTPGAALARARPAQAPPARRATSPRRVSGEARGRCRDPGGRRRSLRAAAACASRTTTPTPSSAGACCSSSTCTASRRTSSTSASPASCTGTARRRCRNTRRDAEDAARRLERAGCRLRGPRFGGTMPSSGMAGRPCALPPTHGGAAARPADAGADRHIEQRARGGEPQVRARESARQRAGTARAARQAHRRSGWRTGWGTCRRRRSSGSSSLRARAPLTDELRDRDNKRIQAEILGDHPRARGEASASREHVANWDSGAAIRPYVAARAANAHEFNTMRCSRSTAWRRARSARRDRRAAPLRRGFRARRPPGPPQ